jgi:hypothetical protein
VEVARHDVGEGMIRTVQFIVPRRVIAPAERDGGIRQILNGAQMLPAAAKAKAERELRVATPSHYPPVIALRSGDDGTMFVRVAHARRGLTWVMIDTAGTLRGVLPIPAASAIRSVASTHIWLQSSDADGMAVLTKYLLRR